MLTRTRASALCIVEKTLLCVDLRDPLTGVRYLMPPGGGLEPGETPIEAATRETLEETGHRVTLTPFAAFGLEYVFTWAGKEIRCLTEFYFSDQVEWVSEPSTTDTYHRGTLWIPLKEFYEGLAFHPLLQTSLAEVISTR